MANESTPSDVVAARVREVRTRRGLTTAQLAARCAALGAPGLTAQALYKLEGQRDPAKRRPRPVTVDELLALSAALNVAPVSLLVPPDDSDQPYAVTATVTASRFGVRAWIRGIGPLLDNGGLIDDDPREFHAEDPRGEFYLPAYAGDDEHEGHGAVQQGPPRRREDSDGKHR
jgi:transcriptional regulator with XRE-family HTH domain